MKNDNYPWWKEWRDFLMEHPTVRALFLMELFVIILFILITVLIGW